MNKKSKKIKGGGLVYSTDKETMENLFAGIDLGGETETTSSGTESDDGGFDYANDQVRVWIDRKSRGGKEAIIIQGITAEPELLKELSTWLKIKCGVGGNVKNDEIIIQGKQRDKVIDLLRERGFKDVKKAGG